MVCPKHDHVLGIPDPIAIFITAMIVAPVVPEVALLGISQVVFPRYVYDKGPALLQIEVALLECTFWLLIKVFREIRLESEAASRLIP